MDNLPYLLNGTVRFWTTLTWILAMLVSKASVLTQNQTLVDNVLLDFQSFTVNLFLSMLLLILGWDHVIIFGWKKHLMIEYLIRVRYSKQLRNSIQCACSRSSWLRPSLRRSRFIGIVTHHSSSSSSSSCSFYWGGASREETKTPARETNYAPLTSTIINYM